MRILGAVLAGGLSSRFGDDKALAMLAGRPLIRHTIDALAAHADTVITCGRHFPGLGWAEDRPAGGHGPLAGLNAALNHAGVHGFDAVLCSPIDVHPLPEALRLLAGARCAVLRAQWTIGLWPAALASNLDLHLADGKRSMRSWLDVTGAAIVDDEHLHLHNINFPQDLRDVPIAVQR